MHFGMFPHGCYKNSNMHYQQAKIQAMPGEIQKDARLSGVLLVLQPQPAQGSQWASVHSSPPAKTLPQQQLLVSNQSIRILQPQATAREVNCRNQTVPPGLQHLRTAFDIKELSP